MDICSSTAAVSHLAHLVRSLLRMRDVRFDNRLRQIEFFKTNPWQQVLMSKFLGDYKIKIKKKNWIFRARVLYHVQCSMTMSAKYSTKCTAIHRQW